MNILERDLAGLPVSTRDPEYRFIRDTIDNAQRIIAKMNTGFWEPA